MGTAAAPPAPACTDGGRHQSLTRVRASRRGISPPLGPCVPLSVAARCGLRLPIRAARDVPGRRRRQAHHSEILVAPRPRGQLLHALSHPLHRARGWPAMQEVQALLPALPQRAAHALVQVMPEEVEALPSTAQLAPSREERGGRSTQDASSSNGRFVDKPAIRRTR